LLFGHLETGGSDDNGVDKKQRRHGAQVLCRGEEGGRPITTHFSALNAKESRLSTPDVKGGHFSTLNAGEKSKFSTPNVDEELSTPDVDKGHFSTLNADKRFLTPDVDKKQQGDVATPCQEGGGKQTVYGIFAQACWAQYDDKAGIEEFHIQCSDWWEDLAEKEREKFQSLATRSDADKNPSSRRLTLPRSDADKKSRFLPPDVSKKHFSTLNADRRSEFPLPRSQSSRRLTSTRSDADKMSGFLTPDVVKRHFLTLNAGGRSGFSMPRSQGS
jgi:hypothetical protein